MRARSLVLLFSLCACEAQPAPDRSGDCASCHLTEYRAAADPVHVDVKPTKCGVCHEQTGWRPSVLHHEWWPLAGTHATTKCESCHGGDVFKGTQKECIGCHRGDFDSSTFPGHSGFGPKCTDCHSMTAWKPAIKIPPPAPIAVSTTTAAPLKPGQKPPPPGKKPPPPPRPDVTTHASPRR